MKKYELIALLKRGTASALARKASAVPAAARAESGSAGPIDSSGHQDPTAQVMEALKQIAAKLDAIAHGVAAVVEAQNEREATPDELDNALDEVEKLEDEEREQKSLSDEVPVPAWPMIYRRGR